MLRIGRRPMSDATPWSPLVRKSDRPVHFWISTVAVSIFPLGFLILPVLTWLDCGGSSRRQQLRR